MTGGTELRCNWTAYGTGMYSMTMVFFLTLVDLNSYDTNQIITYINVYQKFKVNAFEMSCAIFVIQYHTGPSFNTGTENTIQVSKFKCIGGFR